MAYDPGPRPGEIPPPSEELHIPGPSYLPVLVAAGLTGSLVGVVVSIPLFAAGTLLFLVATVLWIREARSEYGELPLKHHD